VQTTEKEEPMKALVYHGPGLRSWEEKPDPTIQDPTDVVVRIDSSTICGTDLHILKGDVPRGAAGHGARPPRKGASSRSSPSTSARAGSRATC